MGQHRSANRLSSPTLNLNGTAMAINYRSDMTRPLTLGLIGLAVVGWLLTFLLFIYRSEDHRDHRRQVRMLQANEAEVRTQLAQQTSASGTLSDLQARIAAAQQQAAQASQAREQAQAQLAPVQQSLLAAQQAAAEATKNAAAQVQRLTDLQSQVQQFEKRLISVRDGDCIR